MAEMCDAADDDSGIGQLLKNNAEWAEAVEAEEPGFFGMLAAQQAPKWLWIGCSDSRVPANEIVGMKPGELFVHRNVANLVQLADLNCLSVVQFAVDVLKVEHIIVVGHYGCSGVRSAARKDRLGLVDHWSRPVRDTLEENADELNAIPNEADRVDRLCELNVLRQVRNLLHTQIVQDAWVRGQKLDIHAMVYGLKDGRMKPLAPPATAANQRI